jgi:hypothetical protein
MEEQFPSERKETLRSWVIIWAIAILLAAWGVFIYFAVGEKGPKSWDFSVVEDIPGESAYSTHQPGSSSSAPESQHVSGKTPGAELIEKEGRR